MNDFTLDKTKYPKPSDMVDTLGKSNQRLVAYVDAAVNVKDRTNNAAYTAGKKVDGFVKSQVN